MANRRFRYRVTHGHGSDLVAFRGVVECDPRAASDGNIRGRILSDIAKKFEFNWIEVHEEAPGGKAVA